MAIARCHRFLFPWRNFIFKVCAPLHPLVMKDLKFILPGILFGIALTKGEAISWYRIQEMFRFESFHMFGIFITAIPTGALSLWIIKKYKIKTLEGDQIEMPKKEFSPGVIIGSLIFGFG